MRVPKMFARKRSSGRTFYYVRVGKRQVPLGSDKDVAEQKYYTIIGQRASSEAMPGGLTLKQLVGRFLAWNSEHRAQRTYQEHQRFLSGLTHRYPAMLAGSIRAHHIKTWIEENRYRWNNAGQRAAVGSAKRLYCWAIERELVDRDPTAGIKRPKPRRRRTTITKEQAKIVLDACPDQDLRDYLELSFEQGWRPEEARTASAKHYDRAERTITFPPEENKTGRVTGEARTIFLTDRTLEILERLAKQWPDGPLLRNREGRPWTKDTIGKRIRRLRKRLKGKVPADLTAYVLRHSYCTDALEDGQPVATVAALMGHSSPQMVLDVYNHIKDRSDHLKEAARQVRPGKPKTPQVTE